MLGRLGPSGGQDGQDACHTLSVFLDLICQHRPTKTFASYIAGADPS